MQPVHELQSSSTPRQHTARQSENDIAESYLDRDELCDAAARVAKLSDQPLSNYGYDPKVAHKLQRGGSSMKTLISADLPATGAEVKEVLSGQGEKAAAKAIAKIAVATTTKKVAADISKWNSKQEELHQSTGARSATPDESTTALISGTADHAKLKHFDYTDEAQIACLLCQRRFKSVDTLHRHTTESRLHLTNLESIDTCRQAAERKHAVQSESTEDAGVYRDRASERRAVFGADTGKPKGATSTIAVPSAKPLSAARSPWPLQSAEEKPIESDNIGNKLLAKMGWTSGQGLGVTGQGRVDIIETKVYRAGAGLGSDHNEAASTIDSRARVAFSGYHGLGRTSR